jgi:hypothetical protein
MVTCWGSYIHIEPLTSLRGAQTASALDHSVDFFRGKGVCLNQLRMDNQSSPEVCLQATKLKLTVDLIYPFHHQPNRAERSIRTAKNHIIATRAGFHPDRPRTFIDKCLPYMELTLNCLQPYEYDPNISAYHGIHGNTFDFIRHPIAPLGCKVLTWDHPQHRGSWADHGVIAIYLGPDEL